MPVITMLENAAVNYLPFLSPVFFMTLVIILCTCFVTSFLWRRMDCIACAVFYCSAKMRCFVL